MRRLSFAIVLLFLALTSMLVFAQTSALDTTPQVYLPIIFKLPSTSTNQLPVASSQSVTTNEDTSATVTLTATDATGNTLTFAIVDQPTHGSLGAVSPVACDGQRPSTCTATVQYSPNANFNGTLASVTIANNTVQSSAMSNASQGSGIRLIADSSAATAAQVTQATISGNQIRNFPMGSGIIMQANSSPGGPSANLGTAGNATNIINVTANLISGASPTTLMNAQGIVAVVNRAGQGNFNISNTVSQTDGNAIYAVARDSNGRVQVKIQNNSGAAPLSPAHYGIRVNSGSASGNVSMCLNIVSNTTVGNGVQGIGLRKQGTDPNINAFGINGMMATSSPGVENYVNSLNPAGSGTLLISATSGFTNCSLP